MLKEKAQKIVAVSLLGLVSLASCSPTEQKDSWFNVSYFQAGTYYFESIEGYCYSEDIEFDESCYFVCTPLTGMDASNYETMIREEAPNGLWGLAAGLPNAFRFEWFNCYFADMPSLQRVSWTEKGQYYAAWGEKESKWYQDYQSVFDSNKNISAYVELHEEDEVLTEARVTFSIPEICELLMYFSFVAAE